MSEFEEIFSRPWSCRTMPCSRTIKTKSNGVLLGRSNEHKCPLWRVQIVLFLWWLSRLDLKEEKSYKRPSSSLLFYVFHVLRLLSLTCFVWSYPLNFLLTLFTSTFFQLYMSTDGVKHHQCLSSSARFPLSLCTSLSLFSNKPRFRAFIWDAIKWINRKNLWGL